MSYVPVFFFALTALAEDLGTGAVFFLFLFFFFGRPFFFFVFF